MDLAPINALAKLYARALGLVRAEERDDYTLLVVRRLIPRWAAGQVWGECVLVVTSHENHQGLLAHERVHVAQWRRHGRHFAVLYGWASLAAWWRGGHYYLDNRFEVEARRQSGY